MQSKKACLTLGGSQPYVLTANWPNGMTPPGTYWTTQKESNLTKMLYRQNYVPQSRVFKSRELAQKYAMYQNYQQCDCPKCRNQ